MKMHKTVNRENYRYMFADGTVVLLKPGENGITAEDIKCLHAMDDSEVYNNIKNSKPEPNSWNVPLTEDYDIAMEENTSDELDRLHEIVATFTPKQLWTYQKVIIEGLPMTQVARLEKVSETAIRHRMEKIRQKIKKNF